MPPKYSRLTHKRPTRRPRDDDGNEDDSSISKPGGKVSSSGSDVASVPSKRQRLIHKPLLHWDDDEDDDEPPPVFKQEVSKQEDRADCKAEISSLPPRLVLLTLCTRAAYPIRCIESEELVRKITDFISEIIALASITRIEITKLLQHDEEIVLLVLQYLKSNTLAPLQRTSSASPPALVQARLSLYDLSQQLGISSLETAVAQQTERCNNMDATTFLEFAPGVL